MTAAALKKYRTISYDEKGKPVSALLNLKNKTMRMAYEKAMEEIEDQIDIAEAQKRMKELHDDPSLARPWSEFVSEYLSKNSKQ